MKSLYALVILSVGTASFCLADEGHQALEEEIRQNVLTNTMVSVSVIQDTSLPKCFSASFYTAEIDTKGLWNTDAVYAKTAAGVVLVPDPPTELELPQLLPLLSASFRMKTEADGKVMLTAMKALYPKHFDDDVEPRILRNGTKWSIIGDKFFKRFSGFVVNVDTSGKITSIKRSLSITE